MAKLVELAVGDLKPDTNQPRKHIDFKKVSNMAQSMKIEGVINPIEVDHKNVIITGEMRWRAAKEAGLATIPCIKRDLSGRERYRRQLIENLHNGTMSALDTAVAIKTLLDGEDDMSMNRLSQEIGINRVFIQEHMDILRMDKRIRERIRTGALPRSITRPIKVVADEYRQAFQEKILAEKLGRDVCVSLSRALNFHPDKAKLLLKEDLSGKSHEDVVRWLELIAPSVSQHMERSGNVEKELHKHISAITKWMAENDLDEVGPVYQQLIKQDFRQLNRNVGRWAQKQGLIKGPDVKKLK